MTRSKIEPPSPQELQQLLSTRVTLRDLADLFGVSRRTMRRWLDDAGFSDHRSYIAQRRRHLVNLESALKRAGSVRACAREMGVSDTTVARWMKQQGISRDVCADDKPAFDAAYPGARARLRAGESFVAVAHDLGISPAALRRAVVREGVLTPLDLMLRTRAAYTPPPVSPPALPRGRTPAPSLPAAPPALPGGPPPAARRTPKDPPI